MEPVNGGFIAVAGLGVLFISLLIALIAGIFVGKDARKRGMSAWGWGIGVFLLMIVFLPVYFIVRKPLVGTVEKSDEFLA